MNPQSPAPLLAPCPFCGVDDAQVLLRHDPYNLAVVCNSGDGGCGTRGPYRSSGIDAHTAWNHRQPYTTLLTAYNELLAAKGGGEWISVEDRLPEDDQPVLTTGAKNLLDGAVMFRGFSAYGTMEWFCIAPQENIQSYPPTHWQHLPPAPGSDGGL